MHVRILFILCMSITLSLVSQSLTVADAYSALSALLQEKPDHPEAARINELLGALKEHLDADPDAYFQEDIEQEILALLPQSQQEHSIITVQQAHRALESFTKANPTHPALPRVGKIIDSLKEHLQDNPTAHFQRSIEQEIHALVGTINSENTIGFIQQMLPWLLKGGVLFVLYKFVRGFISDAQTTQLITQVGQQAQDVLKEMQEVQPLIQELVRGDQHLRQSTRDAADLFVRLSLEQIVDFIAEHERSIGILRGDQGEMRKIVQRIIAELQLPIKQDSGSCCIPKRRVTGG